MIIASRSNLIVLGIVAIAVCWFILDRWLFDPEPVTLEEVQQFCQKQQGQLTSFDVLRTQKWARGKLIVYQGTCQNTLPHSGSVTIDGYKAWIWDGFNWLTCAGVTRGTSINSQPSTSELIQVIDPEGVGCKHQNYVYNFVYGRILTPSIVSVEARLSNGETLQDNGKDGVFMFIASNSEPVCELRALDTSGQMLLNFQLVAMLFPVCQDST